MADNPKLSIITINLNNKGGLKKTIESVICQTTKDFEYIIIDGASTDGSVDLLKQYAGDLSYWLSEKDTGIYNAMNKGIKVAKGEYLLFLNSGDWLFEPNVLEKTLELLEPDVAVGSANIYFDNGKSLTHYTSPPRIDFNYLLNGSLSHPSSLIKRTMFGQYGFYNEANKIASDWEFFFLILILKAERYQKLPTTLTVFNLDGISNRDDMEEIIKVERKAAIERHIPKTIYAELVELQCQQVQYKKLRQRVSGRRYILLEQIENNAMLSRLLTIQLYLISKLAKLLAKSDNKQILD